MTTPGTITITIPRHHLNVLRLALESHEQLHVARTKNPSTPPAIAARAAGEALATAIQNATLEDTVTTLTDLLPNVAAIIRQAADNEIRRNESEAIE